MALDKLQYAIGNDASTTLSGSVSDSDTEAVLTSDTNFAAESGEGMILLDEGQATEELAYSTGKSGATVTIPLANRGLEGGSAQAHAADSTAKGVLTSGMWNNLIAALALIIDKTAGTVKSGIALGAAALTSPRITTSIDDSSGNELVKVTATGTAVNEVTLANAATGDSPTLSATGGDTDIGLDIKMKGDGYFRKPSVIGIQVTAFDDDTTVGQAAAIYRIPAELNGMNLTGVAASVYTAGTTGTLDIQVRNHTDTADMLSTVMTIDTTETDSSTAAAAAVIDTALDDVVTGDIIAIDIDAVHTTEAQGLFVELRFELP